MRGRRIRLLAIAGFAVGGSLLGHALTYVVAIGDPAHRAVHLSQAGHGYWTWAAWIGGLLAAASIAWVFVRHLRGAAEVDGEAQLPRNAALLALLQAGGFVVLELSERLAEGAPLAGVVGHHRLLLFGLIAQLSVAVLGALFLRWLCRAAEALGSLLALPADPGGPGTRFRSLIGPWALAPSELAGAGSVRGPPSWVTA